MSNFDFNNEEEEENINVSELVERYENSVKDERAIFLDHDEFEYIIDYYYHHSRVEDATKVIERALEQYPISAGFLSRKAQVLFDIKEVEEALQLLDIAEMYERSESAVYFLRSDIYKYLGRYDEAIEVMQNLLSQPDVMDIADIYLQMCEIYEDWEKYNEAYDCIVASLEIDPLNEEALERFTFCITMTSKYEESLPIHLRMIDENPYSYLAWYNLANSYRGLDKYELAVDAFEYAIAINEDEEYLPFELAELHYKFKQYQKALDVLKDMCEVYDSDEDVFFLQGKCHEALGNNKMARYCYRKAVHENPIMSEAYFRIGETYKIDGQWEQAYKAFQKANELEKEEYEFCLAMAEAALEIGESDVALDVCETAIDLFVKRHEAYFTMAKIMATYGDFENALAVVDTGLKICKSTIELEYAKCAITFMSNKNKDAEILLRKLLQEHYIMHDYLYDFCDELSQDNFVQEIIADFSE